MRITGVGLIYYGQSFLIYPPHFHLDVAQPDLYDIPYINLDLKTPDGITLKCYLMRQRKEDQPAGDVWIDDEGILHDKYVASRPTIMMFHGNGGNIGHRIPLAKAFHHRMKCNVLMLSYGGRYGLSEGSPSEDGLKLDAQTALDHILSDPNLSQTPIILYGQSIGGAVAIDLASRNPTKISALILENTFTSLPSLVPHVMPLLSSVSFLCHQKWDSISKIPLIPASTPILMLSGEKDQIVPAAHMRALWEVVQKRGPGKRDEGGARAGGVAVSKYMGFPHGTHNDTCVQTGYWLAVAEYVAKFVPKSESGGKAEGDEEKEMASPHL
ncbi:Alpha/Beta hydrolase protein [Infundibulicybe gibba]|nr:Alpha/Beta hydrolase protein [Infundibulicybe gibba]